ncbi:MAG TPA: DUF72 domain-containing protein [Burkholderiaceae bacterium]|nr:DUF72 domain-containing protein [Burkholderiaceae bacterium]
MRMLAGTSGYSFKEWLGHFYPEKLPADEMLRYYAGRLDTVEINNTFYRMPDPAMLERWRTEVPDTFAFTLKVRRSITHDKRLKDAGPDTVEFLRRAAVLGDKLGALLFQLPPFLRKDVGRLRDFLAVLPGGTRAAFEFRHDSWLDDEVYATLHDHDTMLCVADTDAGDTPFVVTSTSAYVRLRRTHYEDAELRVWAERIAAQKVPLTYVYFMHEDEALGTRFALKLMQYWRALSPEATR